MAEGWAEKRQSLKYQEKYFFSFAINQIFDSKSTGHLKKVFG